MRIKGLALKNVVHIVLKFEVGGGQEVNSERESNYLKTKDSLLGFSYCRFSLHEALLSQLHKTKSQTSTRNLMSLPATYSKNDELSQSLNPS